MATKAKKAAPKRTKTTQVKGGAGAAISERSKDASAKKTFGKAAPKQVKAAPAQTARSSSKSKSAGDASIASRTVKGIKDAASSVASVFRKTGKPAKAK